MNEYDLSFNDLVVQYRKIIEKACEPFRGKARKDELDNTALIAFWHSAETYKAEPRCFEIYAYRSIRQALKAYIAKNRCRESWFSLNRFIGGYDSAVEAVTMIQAPAADWDMALMASMFLSHLQGTAKKVAYALLGKSTLANIKMEYQLSQEELKQILAHLREVWLMLYGKPRMVT